MTRPLSLLLISLLCSCAANTSVWETAPACQPVRLSPDLDFQLVRWSRGADDHQRERVRICTSGRQSPSCTDVVEYEAGWLPRFEVSKDAVRIETPSLGVKILATQVAVSQASAPVSVTIVPIRPATSDEEVSRYERLYGLNESPNYDLVCGTA